MTYDINLKHLEYFIKVAKLKSINKAAQALFISQPHLGKIIREMEEKFGVLFFRRGSRGITLTPEGIKFLQRATNILNEMDSLHFHSVKEENPFSHMSISMTKFSHVMESFIEIVLRYQNHPSFHYCLYEGNPDDVIEDVHSGQSDIGIFHFDSSLHREIQEKLKAKGLSYHFLAYVQPHIVLSKNHPVIAAHKPVNLHTLSEYGFIQYLGQYDDLVSNLFGLDPQQKWVNPSKTIYLSSRSALMQLISMSDFYSIGIHDFGLQSSRYQAVSVPISDSNLMLEFGYTVMQGTQISGILEEFVKDIKKRLT